jgi:hypothetical protein
MSESNSTAERPSTPSPRPEEEPSSMPDVAALAPGKPGRARVIRPGLEHVDQICIRILAFIKRQGGRVTVSQLKRRLNAYRYPQVYKAAIQQLLDLGAIEVEKEPGNRRKWISLLEIPERFQATRSIHKRRGHPARSRGRTLWFELFLAKQTLKKALELWVDDVRRAREEGRRRAARAIRAAILAK